VHAYMLPRQLFAGIIPHVRICAGKTCWADRLPSTLLLLLLPLLLHFVGWTGNALSAEPVAARDVLFACTTCLDCSNINFYHLVRGLRSITTAEQNSSSLARLMDMVVVNEVRPAGASQEGWAHAVKKLWPQVVFVQKEGSKQRGQAYSLNLIRRMLEERGATYWLHWEESWRAEVPFLSRAIALLDARPNAVQIDLAPGWTRFLGEDMSEGGRVIERLPSFMECNWSRLWGSGGFDWRYWPLFTLHPSVNRVDRMLNTPSFSEDPGKWPVIFEFDWACTLARSGVTKGILVPPPVARQSGHASSYQRLSNLRRLGICAVMDSSCSG